VWSSSNYFLRNACFWLKIISMLKILSRAGRVLKSELKIVRTKNMLGLVCIIYVLCRSHEDIPDSGKESDGS
jgi:hypothetical protein